MYGPDQIDEMLRDAGAKTDSEMRKALEDGELLWHLGITDEDKEALEILHDKYR